MQRIIFLFLFSTLFLNNIHAQNFTRQDTLRGTVTPERAWWDLQHYELSIQVFPDKKNISGSNIVRYKVLQPYQSLQIDMQDPMKIIKVTQNNKELNFKKDGNAHFIQLSEKQKTDDINEITVFFEGKPKVSRRPPWDGGFTWNKDIAGKDFIATSNQGDGASLWWPCKDHPSDEPDNGIVMNITTPDHLMDVSNGRLKNVENNDDGTKTYQWEVVNPINDYGVNINIADYSHYSETYQGEKGELSCDYYVLPFNLDNAKIHFKQVFKMLEAFEHWFGPYPFYEDGYKLVEVPYWGMEHQSSVTYGNHYLNGAFGTDRTRTGWGLKFDFIIIHESGHEWFANNITYKDIADMWIHEGFTNYSETLYVDYHFGTKAGNEYLQGVRKVIRNDRPIIGKYNVNKSGSSDMYAKGAAMLHTLRQVINDDEKFRDILRGLNKQFYHQTVTTQQIEDYISEKSGLDLSAFFNQYLRTIKIPVLEYQIKDSNIKYRINNIVDGFQIPVKVFIDGKEYWIDPNKDWQELKTSKSISSFEIDANFYINVLKV